MRVDLLRATLEAVVVRLVAIGRAPKLVRVVLGAALLAIAVFVFDLARRWIASVPMVAPNRLALLFLLARIVGPLRRWSGAAAHGCNQNAKKKREQDLSQAPGCAIPRACALCYSATP